MASPSPSSDTRGPLVLGKYSMREEIAQGSTCSVWRAREMPGSNFVAVKIVQIDLQDPSQQHRAKQIVREVRVHESLKHQSILALIGGETRLAEGQWPGGLWMVLDLATGGDLFDKITPDVGLPQEIAHMYFHQLISGLKYIAGHGICHRDIKPENCLVDGGGNLKIADFGLATVYKYKGQVRKLNDRCGSPPYAAPELAIPQPYDGEPIDVWSAGILLYALLVGNTPWDEPTRNSPEFALYETGQIWTEEPWYKIKGAVRDLLQKMLQVDPSQRITLAQIEMNGWYNMPNSYLGEDGLCVDGARVATVVTRSLQQHGYLGEASSAFGEVVQMSQSQGGQQASQNFFSQRGQGQATFAASMQLYSKLSMAPTQRTNPNLTRFFTTHPLEEVVAHITAFFQKRAIAHQVDTPPVETDAFKKLIRFNTKDKRGEPLRGAMHIADEVLPDESPADASGDDGMDVDEGTKGLTVSLLKRSADPLEMKRLWKEFMDTVPHLIHST